MKRQSGFVNGVMLIGIALLGIVAAVGLALLNGDVRDVKKDKESAAATTVVKRMTDVVQDFQVKTALGESQPPGGLAASIAADVARWPIDAFVDGHRGDAVTEGATTYVTDVSEDFCRRINEMMQVDGVPQYTDAPGDRIACVLAPDAQ